MRHSQDGISRRALLERGAAFAALAALPRGLPVSLLQTFAADGEFLAAAKAAERWIASSAIRDSRGTTWPADPADVKSVQNNLYSGSPGVVLLYLELFAATKDRAYLKEAEDGARYLASTFADRTVALAAYGGEGAGLYTGLAGIVHVLDRVHAASGNDRHATAARLGFAMLKDLAKQTGAGIAWSASNDIISGSAGIGLTLLWGARAFGDPSAVELARRAGHRLAEVGIAKGDGLTWEISPQVPRRYPNFSHGAAGVAYFLTQLTRATGDTSFTRVAERGARYLQGISIETPGKGRMVFHSEPGNEQIFYLSWCHGPPGTARLFHALADVTGNREWSAWVDKLTVALSDMGAPEKLSSGFWNNISRCCGNCGLVEHFLALHHHRGETRYLDDAVRVMRNTLSRSTREGEGLKWIQAEHRVRPELLIAQTGLMQGAAGVALALLHLDGALARRAPFVVLPDSPYFA
jgi:lantibiotic modifying enzyme